MTTLQDDIEALRALSESVIAYGAVSRAAWRAIRIMTALAKLDAAQVEIAIEDLSLIATGYELCAATGENEPGWASAAATRRALAEALEACR